MDNLREIIGSDLYRYAANTTFKAFFHHVLFTPGFRYMYLWRKCKYYKEKKSLLFYPFRLFLGCHRFKYGYQIPIDCHIGKGFAIIHFGTIIVNPETVIGNNVDIFPGAVIGRVYRGSKKGCPSIGDKVWIGSNAVIVGKIKIGKNVLIGPGSYVNFNVPDNSVVIGNPGKIVSHDGAEGYIVNTV
jgi:serine O-acetyltransferase